MLAFTRYAAPMEPAPNDFSFFDFFGSQSTSSRSSNKSTLRAVYIAPPSPKSKTIRTGKLVRFNEDVRVRVIHRDPIEDVSLQVWLSSISENNSNKVDEESDSDVSLSSSPPRKLHRSSSPPLQEKKQASSPNFFFFESSIFKAFETHSAGAVRCR